MEEGHGNGITLRGTFKTVVVMMMMMILSCLKRNGVKQKHKQENTCANVSFFLVVV